MGAILTLVLANIPAIIAGGQAVVNFITQIRTAAQQTGEWTTDMETQFQSLLLNPVQPPEWQPDSATLSGVAPYSPAVVSLPAIAIATPKSDYVVVSEGQKPVPVKDGQLAPIVPLSPVQAPVLVVVPPAK